MRSIGERNSLVESHLKLAEYLASRRYSTVNPTVQHGELLSAAYEGLIDAAARFDEKKVNEESTHPFESYARTRINGQMNDYLRSCNWGTRTNPQSVLSLETERFAGRDRYGERPTICDTYIARESSVVDQLNGVELFEKVVRCLPKRERRVFQLRFVYDLTMKEIADSLDISESRVSQIISANIDYLKEVWNKQSGNLWDEVASEE